MLQFCLKKPSNTNSILLLNKRFVNTVKYIVEGKKEYDVDVSNVEPIIIESAIRTLSPLYENNFQQNAYHVSRTSLGKSLPVYLKYTMCKARKRTFIRKIDGSAETLRQEISQFIPLDYMTVNNLKNAIEIKGNYVDQIKKYLTLVGF